MDIANYITGSAQAAQRLTAEASLPPLREGYFDSLGKSAHVGKPNKQGDRHT